MNDETTVEERPLQGRVTGLDDFAGFEAPVVAFSNRYVYSIRALLKRNSAFSACSAVMV